MSIESIVRSGTDLISLLSLFFFFLLLLGRPLQNSLRLRRFKLDRGETWRDCSSNIYTPNDGCGFLIWRHNFKMAAVTSFHAGKRCTVNEWCVVFTHWHAWYQGLGWRGLGGGVEPPAKFSTLGAFYILKSSPPLRPLQGALPMRSIKSPGPGFWSQE